MERISICLQVPKYLKKVLLVKFGEKYQAKENHWFGILVINILQRKSDSKYHFRKENNDECFCFTISYEKARKKGFSISENKMKSIVRSIDRNFREEMYYHAVLNHINYSIDYKISIENFLDSYDITEDELPYETLRKDFNRNKTQIIKKISG
ncbi:MAG: hypothetical protein LBE36_06445 [Flavobacteriaceae bacterium]|jgi:hypothetical protein|nr:hypothetical protein [Flavobacteriaceae bacterium]